MEREQRVSGGTAVLIERSGRERRALRDRRRVVMLVAVDRRITERRFVLDRRGEEPLPREAPGDAGGVASPLIDELTGLFTRGILESALTHELARCRRQGVMTSLLVIDVDDFQGTNDRWGQAVGDESLRLIAQVIHRNVRAIDVSCRYGGDKFAVVLPDTYASGALQVAERIVGEVRREFVTRVVAGCRLPLTVSVGVSSYGATGGEEGALLSAAAGVIHEAKAAGGDCVAVARVLHS